MLKEYTKKSKRLWVSFIFIVVSGAMVFTGCVSDYRLSLSSARGQNDVDNFIGPHLAEVSSTVSENLKSGRDYMLSEFDQLISRISEEHRIDWRLVASIIQIESSFRPNVKSKAGAMGLMQIMPIVAREYKSENPLDPEENIRVGVRHFINWMRIIKAETGEDRLKLTLAAYNAGLGHLRDAQRLARAKGLSPYRWKNVSKMYLLLEDQAYYREAKFGYCQGASIIQYVDKVFDAYKTFKETFDLKALADWT